MHSKQGRNSEAMAQDDWSGSIYFVENTEAQMVKKITLALAGLLVLFGVILGSNLYSDSVQAPMDVGAQSSIPCTDSQNLSLAISKFLEIKNDPQPGDVYGEGTPNVSNPPSEFLSLIERENLAAIENPNGSGVLVSVVYFGGKALARNTVYRTGWLVFDEIVYPIDVQASSPFRLLYDGIPEQVRVAAGLPDYSFGMEAFGFSDFASFNSDKLSIYDEFLVEANALCQIPEPL